MARAARVGHVLWGSLGAGLLFALLYGLHFARPSAAQAASSPRGGLDADSTAAKPREPAAGPSVETDVKRFVALLGKLRGNDESVAPEMTELAERLCQVHGRCDGKEILGYYLGLAPDARARGLEETRAVEGAWTRVAARVERWSSDDAWDPSADEDMALLRKFADRTSGDGDVCPGAMASSFLAFVDLERLQRGPDWSEDDRADLLDAASQEALRSLEGFGKCGMLTGKLQPMWLLGQLRIERGEDREAETEFQGCLSLAHRLGNAYWEERTIEGLIRLAKRAGDLGQVSALVDELASVRTPDTSWILVREQAILLLQQDLGADVVAFLSAHPPADPSRRREWQILLGSAFLRKGELEAAREAFAATEPPPWRKDVRLGMALVEIRAGNAELALEQLSRPEFLQAHDPLERAYVDELRGEALIRLRRYGEATAALQRSLDLGSGLQTRFASERNLLGAATSIIGESIGVHAIALLAESEVRTGRALDAARSIENWQSRTLRQGSGAGEDISTDDLLAWSKLAGAGLVTWVVGADSSVVTFVAPDGTADGAVIPRGRRSIDAAVRRLNDAVCGNDRARAERLGADVLAGILPSAISDRINRARAAGGGRVLFLLHGPLERLPIEFLCRDESPAPLVLPGLPEPRPGEPLRQQALSRWAVLGNPVDAEGRSLLPGAREELALVAALHGGRSDQDEVQAAERSDAGVQSRSGVAFDRASLLAALAGTDPLHLATHLVHGCGRESGRIADVGLELSGGASLCAREILEARPRLPLAVLDACETAEGRFVDAEGLQGVARAFLESGTRNLLVTIRPVEDQAARAFAEEFHRGLNAGRRPSEAAAEARGTLRTRGFPAADWAAFRLVGRD